MRLGGFVIHGNNVGTLERCLASLRPTCQVLVTVDSLSTDGSAEVARRYADETVRLPFRGFGAARAEGLRRLRAYGVEQVFFLDSDERLEPADQSQLQRALASPQQLAQAEAFRVRRANWDLSGKAPYILYTDARVRLFRATLEPWTDAQLVHEAFPRGRYPLLPVTVQHDFVLPDGERPAKQRLYALLWAVQHASSGRRPAPSGLAHLAHVLRDGLSRGALLRGGRAALTTVLGLAEYSRLKHQFLREVRAGQHGGLVAAYQRGALEELFAGARAQVAQ